MKASYEQIQLRSEVDIHTVRVVKCIAKSQPLLRQEAKHLVMLINRSAAAQPVVAILLYLRGIEVCNESRGVKSRIAPPSKG